MTLKLSGKEYFDLLRKVFYDSPTARGQNYEITQLYSKEAEVCQDITPDMFNTAGRMHGMFYFKLMDEASHLAASTIERDYILVTTVFNIFFSRPVSEGKIRCVGKLVNSNKSQYITESILYDEQNREIGRGSGIFVRSKLKIEDFYKKFQERELSNKS